LFLTSSISCLYPSFNCFSPASFTSCSLSPLSAAHSLIYLQLSPSFTCSSLPRLHAAHLFFACCSLSPLPAALSHLPAAHPPIPAALSLLYLLLAPP
jgi:hypothetical protein